MEIKKKLTVTGGEGGEEYLRRIGEGSSRNTYKGPMGVDNEKGGVNVGGGGWVGQGRVVGKKLGQL